MFGSWPLTSCCWCSGAFINTELCKFFFECMLFSTTHPYTCKRIKQQSVHKFCLLLGLV